MMKRNSKTESIFFLQENKPFWYSLYKCLEEDLKVLSTSAKRARQMLEVLDTSAKGVREVLDMLGA